MKITALKVTDFKRLKTVEVEPGDRHLIVVGGNNEQGKSSVLDALSAAMSGREIPSEPVRNGADVAEIVVELDGDRQLTIRRRMPKGGSPTLEVRIDGEKQGSPQSVLNEIVGDRFLDPVAFARARGRQQRDMLLSVVKLDIDLDEIAEERKRLYDERTDVGKEARRQEAVVEDIGELPAIPDEVKVGDLIAQLNEARRKEQDRLDERRKLQRMRDEAAGWKEKLDRLVETYESTAAQIGLVKSKLDAMGDGGRAQVDVVAALDAQDYDTEDITAQLEKMEAAGKERTRIEQLHRRKTEAEGRAEEHRERYTGLSDEIDALEETKRKALEEADLPLDGLDFDDDCVLYKGVPLDQSSGAEQLQVSLAMACAMSPQLKDVWVRDGSLLDEDHLAAVAGFAEKNGYRVWVERVGAGDPGAIVIEEGEVKT